MENPIVTPARAAHYLLRGLLYCQPCAAHLIPAYSSGGQRFYGCPGPGCPHPWIPAVSAEERVWTRFTARRTALNGSAARTVPADQRQAVLAAALIRVTIGERVTDLECDWRD